MLTILNYYRLSGLPVGKDGWEVCYCEEIDGYYVIKLEHEHLSSVKIHLQRELQETWRGDNAYYFKHKDGKPTGVCVTSKSLKDINFVLKTLERFTC
jgi:Ni,Fe-hydrogenase III large subunit